MTTLKCFFSFRSPFACISVVRLRRAAEFRDVDIKLMPVWPDIVFGGHMDNPTDNLFKMAYIFEDAGRQAEVAGINRSLFDQYAQIFQLPENVDYSEKKLGIDMGEEHWERPHKAFLYAEAHGKGWEFADRVCIRRCNFDGMGSADVMKDEVIVEIAEACGLDGTAMIKAIDDPAVEGQCQTIIKASESAGVFGVPFFVLESGASSDRFWGNDRLEYILRQLRGCQDLPVIAPTPLAATAIR